MIGRGLPRFGLVGAGRLNCGAVAAGAAVGRTGISLTTGRGGPSVLGGGVWREGTCAGGTPSQADVGVGVTVVITEFIGGTSPSDVPERGMAGVGEDGFRNA
jgi:hypothetical protein